MNDRLLPASCADRDREVAASARNFLDLALDEKAVVTLITWGLSDRTSWMLHDKSGPRADRLSPRPLPYDNDLAPKPMRHAIAEALRSAPMRPG